MADPLIPAKTPFNYNVGINYESWEYGRTGYSIKADLDQITQLFGLIKTYHDVGVGTANPQIPTIDPTQQQVINYVVKTPNVQLVMGTVNSALAQGGFGSPWSAGLMTSSAYTDQWVQMIIQAFGSKQAVLDHLKMILLGNEVDSNGPPKTDPAFNSYQGWINQSFDNLSKSLKNAGLGSIAVSTTIANYPLGNPNDNVIASGTTAYIQKNWQPAWNGGKPIVMFNQYTPGPVSAPMSGTNYQPVIDYFGKVNTLLGGNVEPFIGETGYSSFYTQANQVTVYNQITAWLNGQYNQNNGHKTVPMLMFDAFDLPTKKPPNFEPQFGIFADNPTTHQPAGLKSDLNLPTWTKTPIVKFRSDFGGNFRSDILVRDSDGGLAVWNMNQAEVEQASAVTRNGAPVTMAASARVAGSGDFNNDGSADILWRDASGRLVLWDMNDANLVAASPVMLGNQVADPGLGWQVAGIADFNFDGSSDILWRSESGGVALWTMNNAQVQSAVTIMQGNQPANPGTAWNIAGAADFDGDHAPDILWRRSTGEVGLWHLDGNQLSSYALIMQGNGAANPGTEWNIAGSGDFNGDGQADILWRRSTGEVGIWELDGSQLVAYSQTMLNGNAVNPGTAWSIAGIGDYNGDGMSDLLWSGPAGQLAMWTMNGFQIQSAQMVNDGTNPMPLSPGWQVAPT